MKTLLSQANFSMRNHLWNEALSLYRDAWESEVFVRPLVKNNVLRILRFASNSVLDIDLVQDVCELMGVSLIDGNHKNKLPTEFVLGRSNNSGKKAVGIASIPTRESGLKQAIFSLIGQVDEFHIYLNGYETIPEWFSACPGIFVYRSQQFGLLGDSGKFFGFSRTDARWYFTCDDDIIYPLDYAEKLISTSVRYRAPVGVHGSFLRFPVKGYYNKNSRYVLHFKWKNKIDKRVHILGTGTMLLDRQLVSHLPYFDFSNMADIWIAEFMAKHSIPMYAVARGDGWLKEIINSTSSIYKENSAKHTDQRVIIDRVMQSIENHVKSVKGFGEKIMIAIKTFNRMDYLRQSIDSLCKTVCDEDLDIVVVVADDGSTDGTLEYLEDLLIPYEFHVIRNQRAYVGGQFNSILRLGKSLNIDFYFIVDDDISFKKSGWMSGYINAARQSSFDHLCHFNLPHFKQICERTKESYPPPRRLHQQYPLEAYVGVRRAMGALFTLTPAVIEKVGFADEVNYFIRGGWHGDYSARCCRAGFNEQERFWDWKDSNEYVELQNTREESYRTAIDWESEDFKRASTLEERQRREAIKWMPRRIYVSAEMALSGPLINIQAAKTVHPITVNEVFEKVFVINLSRRQDRMASMRARLSRCGIVYERFSAVDGSSAEIQEIYQQYLASRPTPNPKARLSSKEFFFGDKTDAQRVAHVEAGLNGPAIRSAGAMAYSLTYRNILRRCLDEGIERVLILDDDCLFHKNFCDIFSSVCGELPVNWRIFQLGTMQYNWNLTEEYSRKLYLPRGVLVASHAVGLHSEVYPILLEGIARMTLPFDIGPLQDAARRFDEESFVCIPNLIIQDQTESDISSSDIAKSEAAKQVNIYRWDSSQYEH